MNSTSWNEYLDVFLNSIRKMYAEELLKLGLIPDFLNKDLDPSIKRYTFSGPCQIYVFDSQDQVAWFVEFDLSKPDKSYEVKEGIKKDLKEFLESSDQYRDFAKSLKGGIRERIEMHDLGYVKSSDEPFFWIFKPSPKGRIGPEELAIRLWADGMSSVYNHILRSRITKSAEEILAEAKIVRKARPSPMLLEAERTIQKSLENLKKIDEHEQRLMTMENELVGVRRLVGTVTFGEWKVLLSEIDKINTRVDSLNQIKGTYDTVLAQQNEFMKQQAAVMNQQADFMKWVKYATILLPIAVISVPVIEIVSVLVKHFLGIQ